MTEVELARELAREFRLDFRFAAELTRLAILGAPFTQLTPDGATLTYLEGSRIHRHGRIITGLHRLLRTFFSDFDVNGLLGTYPMHVLSTAQWTELLGERPGGRLLDVGAGRGDVTSELARLFDEVTVTETSRPMARRLKKRGYRTLLGDVVELSFAEERFDAISLLNVLDRCDRPLSLLASVRPLLNDGGRLIVALVLPYRPFVYEDGAPRAPNERLPIQSEEFELATVEFVQHALLPLGFALETISRAPYLSGGDAEKSLYELDDLLLVCRAVGDVALIG